MALSALAYRKSRKRLLIFGDRKSTIEGEALMMSSSSYLISMASTTVHVTYFDKFQPSVSRTGFESSQFFPAVNCWAISIRPLRGLF